MCWKTSKALKRMTAREGMVVYKVLWRGESGDMLSFFQKFEYVTKKAYSIHGDLEINERDGGVSSISEGFHSYDGKCMIRTWVYENMISIYGLRNDEAIQRYDTDTFKDKMNIVIAKCVIPEDYTYYENEYGEIVSDGISVTEDYISCGKLRDYVMKETIERITAFDGAHISNISAGSHILAQHLAS